MTGSVLEVLGPSTGGIRRHVAALARALPGLGWQVTIAAPSGVMVGLATSGLATETVEVAVAESAVAMIRRPLATWSALRDLRRLAANVDVVHAHGLKAATMVAVARVGRPFVVTVHNIVLDEVVGRRSALLRRVERTVIARADWVICGSAEIEQRLGGVVAPQRLCTVTPAVDDPVPQRDRRTVRDEWLVRDGSALVVAVARLHPQKQLDVLIRAFGQALAGGVDGRLVIIGDGPERAELQDLIDGLDLGSHITLAGARANPADEMSAADLVVLSSAWEGVPLAIAEALQLGRPVVMTAVGTIGAQMALDGAGGTAVAVGDEAAFASAIEHYLLDPAAGEQAGLAGRSVGERYRAEHLVADVASVYGEVASMCGEVGQ